MSTLHATPTPGPTPPKRNLATRGCASCDLGRFSVTPNDKYTCTPCGAGNFSDVPASTCKQCAAGQYNSLPGQVACVSCTLAGTLKYTDQAGQSTCKDCTEGLKPTNIADACTCIEPCDKGMYGKKPVCTACPAGRYVTTLGARVVEDCGNCPLGRWSAIKGSSSLALCHGCAVGKRGRESGQATEAAGCVACIAGKNYQDRTGQATCVPAVCPRSEYATDASSANAKPQCKKCPVGTYGSVPGLVNINDCFSCSLGKYSKVVGASDSATCKKCPAGQ